MAGRGGVNGAPDSLPDDMHEQTSTDLMRTLVNFCNESMLSRSDIIGSLEFAKALLIRSWIADGESD